MTEDGCKIDEGMVEWRENSARPYCRNEDADCYGPLPRPGKGHAAALSAAKVHALATGHRCTVESTDHYIVDVTRA